MIYRVETATSKVTDEELTRLYELGCDKEPFISYSSYSVYRAEMNTEAVETARTIGCVTSIEKMPTYGVR